LSSILNEDTQIKHGTSRKANQAWYQQKGKSSMVPAERQINTKVELKE
jgi:hypothetical protein